MRRISVLITFFLTACGSGGGGSTPEPPTLDFLTPASDTLRTIGPSGATLRIAYEDDAEIAAATTSLFAELGGVRLPIAENRPHGSGATQEVEWDLSGVPEGVYTIVGVAPAGFEDPERQFDLWRSRPSHFSMAVQSGFTLRDEPGICEIHKMSDPFPGPRLTTIAVDL